MRAVHSLSAVVPLMGLLIACSSSPTGPGDRPGDRTTGKITVAPSSSAIAPGASLRLTAAVGAADGSRWSPPDLTWRSSDPSIATVGSGGLVEALRAGRVQIIAKWAGTAGVASVTVLDSGSRSPQPCVELMAAGVAGGPDAGSKRAKCG